MTTSRIIEGDCREVMAVMDAESVDSIVTDPPYGLSFMGKGWDRGVPGEEFWTEALRVAKPGAHLLAFGGTRMVHRLAVAIEDAGWEIRDRIHWVYGSGFPKSMNVAKAIDATLLVGNSGTRALRQTEQETGGKPYQLKGRNNGILGEPRTYDRKEWEPTTKEAQQWHGWGTALKPAVEPIILARKPLAGTVAANVLEHGTGAINVDGCRVDMGDEYDPAKVQRQQAKGTANISGAFGAESLVGKEIATYKPGGRWPANLIHDGSDEATAGMGDAERYFYCPKASKKDRGPDNKHPTVKPTELMAYLCRLVTPPGGTVLDPFNGSGSTGKAAIREGFNYIGIEIDHEYAEIARGRISAEEGSPSRYRSDEVGDAPLFTGEKV